MFDKNEWMNTESIKERAKRIGVPVIGAPDKEEDKPVYDPNPIVAICGKCGLEMRQMMSYSCNKNNCPTGLGNNFIL